MGKARELPEAPTLIELLYQIGSIFSFGGFVYWTYLCGREGLSFDRIVWVVGHAISFLAIMGASLAHLETNTANKEVK